MHHHPMADYALPPKPPQAGARPRGSHLTLGQSVQAALILAAGVAFGVYAGNVLWDTHIRVEHLLTYGEEAFPYD